MCPQRTQNFRSRRIASSKILKKRLCVHPTTMFRIARVNNSLIRERSPKMVKYSAPQLLAVTSVPHHHCC